MVYSPTFKWFLYIFVVNVGKYTSPMDPTGHWKSYFTLGRVTSELHGFATKIPTWFVLGVPSSVAIYTTLSRGEKTRIYILPLGPEKWQHITTYKLHVHHRVLIDHIPLSSIQSIDMPEKHWKTSMGEIQIPRNMVHHVQNTLCLLLHKSEVKLPMMKLNMLRHLVSRATDHSYVGVIQINTKQTQGICGLQVMESSQLATH